MTDRRNIGALPSPVVGQFFGLFDGVSKEQYQRIVAAAPFNRCNLLILAFVRTFTFERLAPDVGGRIYVAQFANGRVDNHPLDPNNTDGDRIKVVVETARKKNPSINILVSLGWGDEYNDAGKAALTPVAFADSVRTLVQAYDLNGFDIDFESTEVEPGAMLALAQEIRRSLNKIPSKRPMIMTITPAQPEGLNKNVLEVFDYIMPQTYGHGGGIDFTDVTWYAQQLGSYERIVYGLNSEGYAGDPDKEKRPDDPKKSAAQAKKNRAAGIFAWRLNADSIKQGFPTFATAGEMWKLMHPAPN
jgi:chitinase